MRVITYHVVKDCTQFERQLRFLKRSGYTFLTLAEFLDKLAAKKPFRRTDLLVTFDDGSYTVYEQGMPLLKKYNIPAVLFIVTSLIDTNDPFWWDEILYYTQDPAKVRWAKTVGNRERLEYIETLKQNSPKPRLQQQQLTVDELRTLEKNGIAIGNHSVCHPMLDKLTDLELESELINSSKFLEENGFEYHNVIAYPNGNISDMVVDKVKQARYRAGFLFNHQIASLNDTPYKISRLSVNDYTPLWKYRLILSGAHSILLNAKKKAIG